MVSFQDEFGGYSSRLRLNQKRQKLGESDSDDANNNVELNLCELLGIDVEAIAIRIAMGLDEDEDEPDAKLQKRKTATSMNEPSTSCNEDSVAKSSPFKDSLRAQGSLVVQKRERSLSSTDLLKHKIEPSYNNSTQVSQNA